MGKFLHQFRTSTSGNKRLDAALASNFEQAVTKKEMDAAIAAAGGGGGGSTDAADINIVDAGGYFTGTDVEAALQELGAGAGGGLSTHLADPTAAHAASAISYAGGTGMSATDVEAAIDELATEKADTTALSSYLTTAAAASTYLPLAGGRLSGTMEVAASGSASRITTTSVDFGTLTGAVTLFDASLARTAANELTLASGDALKLATAPAVSANDSRVTTTAAITTALGSYLSTAAAAANYLQLAGGTLTGDILINDTDGVKVANPGVDFINLRSNRIEAGGASGIGDWIIRRTAAGVARLDSGDAIRAQSDPVDGEDLTRKSWVDTQLAGKQPLDTDLTTIAGLTATTDNVIQSVGSAWASRTPAQLKSTLALAKADVGLSNVDNTSDANKPVSTAQAAADALRVLKAGDLMTGELSLEYDGFGMDLNNGWLGTYATGDAFFRSYFDNDELAFGSGSASPDVTISHTGANELTLAAGDVLKLDTRPEGTSDTTAATTAFVQTATGSASSNRPHAYVAKTAAQSLGNGSFTVLTFDTEVTDTDTIANLGTTNNRLTCVSAGTYDVAGQVSTVSGVNSRIIRIVHRNIAGTLIAYRGVDTRSAVATHAGLNCSDTFAMAVGDYVELEVFQNSGGALNTTNLNATYHATFSMTWNGGTGAAWGNAGVRAYKTAAQNITTGAAQAVTWDTETFDIDGMHSTSANTSRFTCVTPGTYQFSGALFWGANATGFRAAKYRTNGVAGSELYAAVLGAISGAGTQCPFSFVVQMSAGDYVEIYAEQNSGSTVTLDGTHTYCSVVRVGYQTNPSKIGQLAAQATVTTGSAPVAAGQVVDHVTSVVLQGDGVNYMWIEGYISHAGNSAGGFMALQLWDGAVGIGINTSELAYGYTTLPGASLWVPLFVRKRIAPFTGTKTIRLATYVGSAGTATWHSGTAGKADGYLRAVWDGPT